jgi:hypothetical protein
VTVYDLSHPDDLEHTGKLEPTHSYLGRLPGEHAAGSCPAPLIKWSFRGEVWLADIEDTRYCFVIPDAGVAASIDKKDLSALLVYQEHSNTKLVLQEALIAAKRSPAGGTIRLAS